MAWFRAAISPPRSGAEAPSPSRSGRPWRWAASRNRSTLRPSASAWRAVHSAREARRDADVLRVDDILAEVRTMRPAYPWAVVARTLARKGARRLRRRGRAGTDAAAARQRRSGHAGRDGGPDAGDPDAGQHRRHLEHLHCRTPRGETRWSISSVQNLLAQAVAQGLLVDRPLADPAISRRRGRPPKSLRPAK
jgi:hypothetical protein